MKFSLFLLNTEKEHILEVVSSEKGWARVEGKSDRLSQESKTTARSHDRTNKHNIYQMSCLCELEMINAIHD